MSGTVLRPFFGNGSIWSNNPYMVNAEYAAGSCMYMTCFF